MRIEGEEEQGKRPSGKAGTWSVILALMLVSAAFLLTGAQLAFLVRLPHLSTLVRDPQALWLVFSTWPEMSFGLFYLLLVPSYQVVSGWAESGISPLNAACRIRRMNRPTIIAVIGVSVFLLPLVLAAPGIFLHLAGLLFCAVIGCLIFVWASRTGMTLFALWLIAALSVGLFGNLLMSDANHRSFACRAEVVQLRSGESLPCSNLVWLSGKPLWLVESPQQHRLVLRTDIDDAQVDRALSL